MGIDPEAAEVKASGGVVGAAATRGIEVALVHRPRYDDWSFPKGKLDPGESWEDGALREVEEEIGLRCRLGHELPPTSYRDNKGRAKVVRYWMMEPLEGEFVPTDEVDEMRWLPPADAARSCSATSTTASCCARSPGEPRSLPGPARRLGAARRPGRHADGRQRDRGDGRLHALRPQRQPRRRCSQAAHAPTSWSRPRAASVGTLLGGDPRGVAFGPSMTAHDDALRGRRRPRARSRATRSSARGSTTTPTSRPWLIAAERAGAHRALRRARAGDARAAGLRGRGACSPTARAGSRSPPPRTPSAPCRTCRASSPPPTPSARACTSTPCTPPRTAGSTSRRSAATRSPARPTSGSARTSGSCGRAPSCSPSWRPDKLRPSPDEVPDRWELGTLPFESLAGVRAAADYVLSADWDAVRAHEESLLARRARRPRRDGPRHALRRRPRPRADADVQRRRPHLGRGRRRARRAARSPSGTATTTRGSSSATSASSRTARSAPASSTTTTRPTRSACSLRSATSPRAPDVVLRVVADPGREDLLEPRPLGGGRLPRAVQAARDRLPDRLQRALVDAAAQRPAGHDPRRRVERERRRARHRRAASSGSRPRRLSHARSRRPPP